MAIVNENNVIAKVLSIIENSMEGDSVLLVQQHIPNALKTVCKFVAENKPIGHEKLLLEQIVNSNRFHATNDDYGSTSYFLLTDLTYPIVDKRPYHSFIVLYEDLYSKGFPVNIEESLSLAPTHGTSYYFEKYPRIYVNSTTANLGDISAVILTHYIYATIAQFPDELEDLLVAELVKIIQNEPTKQKNENNEV